MINILGPTSQFHSEVEFDILPWLVSNDMETMDVPASLMVSSDEKESDDEDDSESDDDDDDNANSRYEVVEEEVVHVEGEQPQDEVVSTPSPPVSPPPQSQIHHQLTFPKPLSQLFIHHLLPQKPKSKTKLKLKLKLNQNPISQNSFLPIL